MSVKTAYCFMFQRVMWIGRILVCKTKRLH
uniref:Uncharacterized protein n=1 Tax=Myoviridae sp. ctLEM34 TaxID=2825082 RepID=A0A8S5TR53_9CAUD|nr:MAG TPA: hypothetical protein [Myoviridae sp. ctLEM34]DAV55202.1 MAG TPA: hypothetical protein [Caudoviricetes sp.]